MAPGSSASRRWSVAVLALAGAAAWAATQGLAQLSEHRAGADAAARARPGDIRMISSVDCRFCAEARTWFRAHDVPFSECLIERDADCAAAFRALQAPGTPLLVVRGTRLVGFDPRAVANALAAPPFKPS